MVQLQLQKAKFDAQEANKQWRYRPQGEAEEFEDPNSPINAVIEKMNKSDK